MTGTISKEHWIALGRALSTERLAGFVQNDDFDHDQAVARYLWNSALCESLYPTLHGIEIAARNRLDTAICKRFGNQWLDNDRLLLPQEIRRVTEARDKLARRGKSNPTHSEVVAELTLGFWVGLFHKYYERPDKLWVLLSNDVMSGAPRSERLRTVFYARMDEVRDVRNRAYHYEPLWYWQDLVDKYHRACELLRWFSPEIALLASQMDRFEEVYSRGIDAYECLVEGGSVCPIHNIACRPFGDIRCPSVPDAHN